MSKRHHSDYDEITTARCERALVTLLGNIGPWRQRVYLAGGLAPRYIVGKLTDGARPHVGTTDVDLVIALALSDESPEAYRTLESNLRKAKFAESNSSRATSPRSPSKPIDSTAAVRRRSGCASPASCPTRSSRRSCSRTATKQGRLRPRVLPPELR